MTVCLLLRKRGRKLAVADADRKALDEFRYRIFAVGSDQFGERREQAGLRQAVAVDAVMAGFSPGIVEVAERRLLLFLIGQWVTRGREGRWLAHETQHVALRAPQRSASNETSFSTQNRAEQTSSLEKVNDGFDILGDRTSLPIGSDSRSLASDFLNMTVSTGGRAANSSTVQGPSTPPTKNVCMQPMVPSLDPSSFRAAAIEKFGPA
jgi:hypothetical protein